jgi:AMMECR1 domain-containing protein
MRMRINRQIIYAGCAILLAVLAFPQESRPVEDPLLSEWSDFSGKPECKKLLQWLRCQAKARLTGTMCGTRFDAVTPGYFGSLGMFVTLKKGNRVRGCFGAFSHSGIDAGSLLSDYLAGALTRDPRYHPLDISELNETRIIVTITSQPYPVNDISSIDILHYGIALQCGNENIVFVPAEIKNTLYIEKTMKDSICQISIFRAVTLE